MARKKSTTLTEAELRLMDVLWKKHEATANHFKRQAAQSREFADRLERL